MEEAIQEASRLLGEAVASGKLPPSALNPFEHTERQRTTVSRLLARWVEAGRLGGRVTAGDLPGLVSRLIGLGPLDGLVRDESVISIQVMAHDRVLAQRSGVWQEEPGVGWDSARDLRAFGEALAARAGQELSPQRLVCQAAFESPPGRIQIDGTARNGSRLTIHVRLGRRRTITLQDMEASGALSAAMHRFLVRVAKRTLGALIVGLPGTGKTTLLEAWLDHWPHQPAIALDDGSEFHPRHPLIVTYDVPAERLAEACAFALRKNVDRMTVAEVRGDEAAEMLRYSGALTTWTTLHGDTHNAVGRMMALVQGAEGSPYVNVSTELLGHIIAQAFPLLVETDRLIIGGRAAFFISRIDCLDDSGVPRPLFQADVEGGEIAFINTGDPEAFLARHPRRVYGGTAVPSLGTLAALVDEDPPLALAALTDLLRARPNDARVLALIRRLIREDGDVRGMVRAHVQAYTERIGAAVADEDWGRAQRLTSQALSNPVLAAIGGQVGGRQLADVPPEELARRARVAAQAREVLRLASGPRHVLSLLGALEQAEACSGHLGGLVKALRERIEDLSPRTDGVIHHRGLREEEI